jgi:CheY-like chemotaxis protein
MPSVLTTKRQVLLIEDNADRVDQFRRTLQRDGFDVFTASIPLEAEAMASGLRPKIIVMDVNFANGAGWNILQKLKDRDDTFDIPVIVVTLGNESERAYQMGAHTFLQHPIMPEQLMDAIKDAEKESDTERILIIDDQPESTRLLTQLLDTYGQYRVFSAHNGLEGVSRVARRRPDLVILDLRMPEMDGFAVLQELRSNPETANIPVLVVTGDTLNASERDLLVDVGLMYKTDISIDDYRRFIDDVATHLSRNGD